MTRKGPAPKRRPSHKSGEVQVTTDGVDLESTDGSYDGHARIENLGNEKRLMVDVFDSGEEDPDEAQVESEAFFATPDGAKKATSFLKDQYGFDVTLVVPQKAGK